MKFFLFLAFISFQFFTQVSLAQSINYEKRMIKKLTSEKFSGRGYVDDGMKRSAEFIAKKFKQNGVKPFTDSYFQKFNFPINIIQNAELSIQHKKLTYGVDFIVHPASTSNQSNSITSENLFFSFDNQRKIASLSQIQSDSTEFIIDEGFKDFADHIDFAKVISQFDSRFEAINVLGYILGQNTDSLIVITAHYDHLGKVGDVMFAGANDNASGVAMMLGLTKHYKKEKPKYTTVFIAFGAEEAGLIGSDYFVNHPFFDLKKIKFLINLDILGTGEEGIQVVNSSLYSKEFEILNNINQNQNYLPQIKSRGEACNSDHCPFHLKGIKSFYIYTLGGSSFYHDPRDDFESISLANFGGVKNLLIDFLAAL